MLRTTFLFLGFTSGKIQSFIHLDVIRSSSRKTALVLLAITLRIVVDLTLDDGDRMGAALQGLNFVQVGTLLFTTVTNILATVTVSAHVLYDLFIILATPSDDNLCSQNRLFMRKYLSHNRPTKSMRILGMIVVSGWSYSAYIVRVYRELLHVMYY